MRKYTKQIEVENLDSFRFQQIYRVYRGLTVYCIDIHFNFVLFLGGEEKKAIKMRRDEKIYKANRGRKFR